MKKTAATKQTERQIEGTSLQSNINELMIFFENDKEAIHKILDDFFLTWSYQNQDSGMVKEVFNKYTYTHSLLKKIVRSIEASEDIELINFKKVNNVKTITISDPKFDEESKHLISCLQSFGEGGNYFEINYDLMAFAMPELIGSKTFIELPSERRKSLFDQFAILRSVLNLLDEFVTEHNCTTSNN